MSDQLSLTPEYDELMRLKSHLHSICRHPDFQYLTTGRDSGPATDGWELNVDKGEAGHLLPTDAVCWRRRITEDKHASETETVVQLHPKEHP